MNIQTLRVWCVVVGCIALGTLEATSSKYTPRTEGQYTVYRFAERADFEFELPEHKSIKYYRFIPSSGTLNGKQINFKIESVIFGPEHNKKAKFIVEQNIPELDGGKWHKLPFVFEEHWFPLFLRVYDTGKVEYRDIDKDKWREQSWH